ncbi:MULTISPECIES: ATP-binding protein [unclassified Streptomyces]|uniref:ATP-binding protein n=1 Tax=unclassified Streptomyces TaxID=2593676 RepID=UPI0006FBF98B|nr:MULTISPECIES: ATP-binding protein [unclassified Streptomyces]KQX47356.1 AAA family ATPase [Streptomyces sp. Root1304]KRA94663.1 AAA family ATPase [Streptomyces sp. Root66D1]
MDPINPGSEEYGHDAEGEARQDRGVPGPAPAAAPAPARARVVRLVSGDLLVTVNPVDGSEIEACPPGREPAAPRPRTPEERAEAARAAAPPVPPGPAAPPLPLLERQEQRDRLAGILGRGRSARLTGPAGSGRTALLDAVAADCAGLAPDGVIRLSGHHRTALELLRELFTAVRYAPDHRPDRADLLDLLGDIGAVVVVDDLEFGGAALDELLAAAPECAFLLAAGPDTPAPSADAHIEEIQLAGLGRGAALKLLESAVGRTLTDEEANWAGDLWFESEGLPLRFVQAGALLRQRDRLRVTPAEFDAFGALEEAFGPTDPEAAAAVAAAAFDGLDDPDVELREIPLPSLGEGAAPAALLASRLSRSAQTALRFAVALGGEVPHQAHLPALVGDTHADAALGELMACGLLSPVGPRYRLADGVLTQLLAQGYEPEAAARAHTAAQHYAWWAAHPSVTPERAAAESDALLAALSVLVAGPGTGVPAAETDAEVTAEHRATAVLLARAAAPAFAAGLHWGAWERALRAGQEAARLTGEVAEEAYFHHELGVLALCAGNLERARAELEASIGMRGVLADKRGTVAGRRALALVADLSGEHTGPVRAEEPFSPPRGTPALRGPAAGPGPAAVTAPLPGGPVRPAPLPAGTGRTPAPTPVPAFPDFADEGPTFLTRSDSGRKDEGTGRGAAKGGILKGGLLGARRNLAAVGAGALLVAVLGTVVTLGATSGNGDDPATNHVTTDSSATEGAPDDGEGTDEVPAEGEEGDPGETGKPTGSDSPSPSASGSASPTDPTGSGSPSSGTPSTSDSPTNTTAPATTTAPPTSPNTTTRPPRPTSSSPKPTTSSPKPTTSSPTTSPEPSTTPPTTTTAPPATEENSPSNSASSSLGGPPADSETPA